MPTDGSRLLAAYKRQDAILVRAGFHPTSRPWMSALERFWLSGKTRFTVRKGRQSGFSTTMARVAVCTGLYGQHRITRGTRLAIPFVSIKLSEAGERLYNIGQILDALGVATRPTSDAIEVADDEHPPVVFLTLACNFRTAVGLTAAAAFEDEMARWSNDDGSANPGVEVDAALMPMGVTQENFRVYGGSSPLGHDDFHAALVARGETEDQCVFEGPSWFWNPTISEEGTRRLQADERTWLRDFAAVPQAGRLAAFDPATVVRAFDLPESVGRSYGRVGVIDASSGKRDDFTFAVCGWSDVDGERRLVFDHVDGFPGARVFEQDRSDVVVSQISSVMREHGVRVVLADQREAFTLSASFSRNGLRFVELAWTAPRKESATMLVRRWLADDLLVLPNHEKLRRQLLSFEERTTASGGITFGGRGTASDDYTALLVTTALGDAAGYIPGSPHARRGLTAAWIDAQARGVDVVGVFARAAGVDLRSLRDFETLRRIAR